MRLRHSMIMLGTGLMVLIVSAPVQAAVQDTDLDGLTDQSETTTYGTNPLLFDTDGDGIGDGEEIIDSTNPLDPASSHLTELQSVDPGIFGQSDKRAWYFGRATGIVAFFLFSLVVIHGLIMTSRVWMRIFSMATINAIHEYLSLSALSIVVLHIASFFFDQYLKIGFSEALIPFTLNRPFLSVSGVNIGFAVAPGIIALYLGLVLIFTSLYRQMIPLKIWRAIHYCSFVFYLLILIHGFLAGSDSATMWMRTLYAASVTIILLLILLRVGVAIRLRRVRARQAAQHTAPIPE